jgi:hypothetical protein
MTTFLDWDFESGTISSKFNAYGGGGKIAIVTPDGSASGEPPAANSPTKAFYFCAAGNGGPGGNTDGSDGTDDAIMFFTSSNTVYGRFYWWISPTLTSSFVGCHGFRVTRRIADQYTNHWEMDTPMRGASGGNTSFCIDVLFHDDSINNEYHDLFNIPLGQWNKFEFLYILSAKGVSDGVVKFWLDGTLKYSNTAVPMRSAGSSMNGFDTFLLNTNWDDGGTNNYWYMDDVYLSDTDESGGGSGSNPITFKGSRRGHRGIGLFR